MKDNDPIDIETAPDRQRPRPLDADPPDRHPEAGPAAAPSLDGGVIRSLSEGMRQVGTDLGIHPLSVDASFVSFLRVASRFGVFAYGPITLDLATVEDLVARHGPRPTDPDDEITRTAFWDLVAQEMRQSGRRAVDERHVLLAFVRLNRGTPRLIFGELGVSPEHVEAHATGDQGTQTDLEKLYTPEQVAEYLGVHVQTVRTWIRTGRLPAQRLAGQRALRVRASDLNTVLEPVRPDDAP